MRLSFLRDTSDRVELEDREPHPEFGLFMSEFVFVNLNRNRNRNRNRKLLLK
jgi:hypothetical protein